ncbi:MAG: hypothetical protein ACRD5F_13130 [Candidatus Acidiferrales bacterium]
MAIARAQRAVCERRQRFFRIALQCTAAPRAQIDRLEIAAFHLEYSRATVDKVRHHP